VQRRQGFGSGSVMAQGALALELLSVLLLLLLLLLQLLLLDVCHCCCCWCVYRLTSWRWLYYPKSISRQPSACDSHAQLQLQPAHWQCRN
jgi:hypothetical protein